MKKIFFLLVIAYFVIFAPTGCENFGEKVFKVGDLVDKVIADKDGWNGKEVTVSGYVSSSSGSDGANGYSLYMTSHKHDESERHVICKVSPGTLPEGIITKDIEVRGKIGAVYTQSYLNLKNVTLDSCQIKQ